ncbi:hypothetical protein KEM52_004956 [Ascosphaera acerosa]|nr:hypothetical protein KEM52_004956 [Ascosphaera acerosa]
MRHAEHEPHQRDMVLLTSSTVAALLSTSVIVLSTAALFLAGFKVQQASLRGLQRSLQEESHHFYADYGKPIFDGRRIVAESRGGETSETDTEGKLPEDNYQSNNDRGASSHGAQDMRRPLVAHVQLLDHASTTTDLCSALLHFDLLARNSSIAFDKVLVYPASLEASIKAVDLHHALNRLRSAGVVLHAVDVPPIGSTAPTSESRILEAVAGKLLQYQELYYLRAPGLLLDVERLDRVFLTRPKSAAETLQERMKQQRLEKDVPADIAWMRSSLGQTWLSARLSMSMVQLPAAFKISKHETRRRTSGWWTSSKASISRAYVPSAEVRRTFVVPSSKVTSQMMVSSTDKPAYVYFESQLQGRRRVRVRGNEAVYKAWWQDVARKCSDVKLSD